MKAKVVFIGKKTRTFFFEKKSKWPTKKELAFQLCKFSIFVCENFMDWSFG